MGKTHSIIKADKNTPEVLLSPEGIITFEGRLIPQDALAFFDPVEKLIKQVVSASEEYTYLKFKLEYINSDSVALLHRMIRKVKKILAPEDRRRFIIDWYYEDSDEDMFSSGILLSSELALPFNLIRLN